MARRAVTEGHAAGLAGLGITIDLVTIVTPHGGVKAANWSLITLGVGRDSFRDLGTWSDFIREPGPLGAGVRHVKVVTLETGARRWVGTSEINDDFLASRRQVHPIVDAAVTENHYVEAGHVGVLNMDGDLPEELAGILDSVIRTRRDLERVPAS